MSRISQKGATGILSLFQTISETVGTAPFSASSSDAGQLFETADAREFVLVQAGAVNLAAGVLVQAPALVANHQNLTVTAFSAGTPASNYNTTSVITNQSTSPATVTVTLAGTAATVNQYAGGYAVVNAGTGVGQTLKISTNPAQATTTGALVVTLEDAPLVALDTSSKVCLIPSLYNNVIINPASPSNTPVGVTLYPIVASTSTVNSFGLIQTRGAVSCLAAGAVAVGLGLIPSAAVAGAVTIATATGATIGRALQAAVDTESRAIYLDL